MSVSRIREEAIIEYAQQHSQFTKTDIFKHLSEQSPITESALAWHLFTLVKEQKLMRIGRGVYQLFTGTSFVPVLTKTTQTLYRNLKNHLPFADFCIYEGESIAPLQHHLAANKIIYIETNREAMESVFNFLKEKGKNAYLKPNKEFIYNYVDMSKQGYFVKPLISEAPVQMVQDVPTSRIEKLLVDILADSDFFYLQGSESQYIFENAFQLYTINTSKLLRYASRRGIKQEVETLMQ